MCICYTLTSVVVSFLIMMDFERLSRLAEQYLLSPSLSIPRQLSVFGLFYSLCKLLCFSLAIKQKVSPTIFGKFSGSKQSQKSRSIL